MISVMRPDIDSPDENIRLVTSKAFAVVASSLGLNAILPFLKAICETKKSWLARDTGIKIIQQIAILMGCAVLPHLTSLVNIIGNGLKDEKQKNRTFTVLAISSLPETIILMELMLLKMLLDLFLMELNNIKEKY